MKTEAGVEGTSITKLKNKMKTGGRTLRETERRAEAEMQAHWCTQTHTADE